MVLAFVLAACGAEQPAASGGRGGPGGPSGPGGGKPVAVTVATITAKPWTDTIEALGTANANESVTITAKVTETVARVQFEDGDYVDAVEYLQSEKGIRVEVISAGQCTSQALLDVCDSHTDLGEIKELFRQRTSAQPATA